MISRWAISLALAISIAAMAGGCGSGGDPSGGSAISKAEFVKHANIACKKVRADLGKTIAFFEHLHAGEEPERFADLAHYVILPTIESEIWKVEALPIPPKEERHIAVLLDVERRELDDLAVRPRIHSIARAERHFGKSARMFRAYGLLACINGPGAKLGSDLAQVRAVD